jgi:hypothetical protein
MQGMAPDLEDFVTEEISVHSKTSEFVGEDFITPPKEEPFSQVPFPPFDSESLIESDEDLTWETAILDLEKGRNES